MKRRQLATVVVLVVITGVVGLMLRDHRPGRSPASPTQPATGSNLALGLSAEDTTAMPWGRARYVDGSVFRFSSYPLSRTQPTTIRYELAGYKKELLLKALAEDYENRGGTLIPLTLNRVVRETEVRQGARVLLKRDDEVRGDSIERFSEMTMSSSEWEAGLSSGERLLIDVTYRRYWATAVDGAVCGAATRATTIFNDSPFVPVEAGPQVQN